VCALLGWRSRRITGSPTAMPTVCDAIHLTLNCEEAVQRNLERDLVRTVFEPCARDLVARAHLTPQTRVLDHACGTGVVARTVRAAVPEIGPIVGIDPMTEALEVAAEAAPQEKWIRAEAEALPFGDDRFDVLLCQHSLQHFYSRRIAFAEVKRVLAPGGRAWFSVWSRLEDNPGYFAIRDALAGIDETRAMAEGIARGFWDAGPAQLVHELDGAGLQDVSCNAVTLAAVFASADELPSQWLACSIGICRGRRSRELPPDLLEEFIARASEPLGRYRTPGGAVEVPMTVHVVTGTA
jgi:SAM-dependent methyltransferase